MTEDKRGEEVFFFPSLRLCLSFVTAKEGGNAVRCDAASRRAAFYVLRSPRTWTLCGSFRLILFRERFVPGRLTSPTCVNI